MKGVVEVYRGEEKILEEPNMLMDNLGSQIAFWMSLPRGFGEIESASAIYDTSNYTVRAASLAKDAAGYNRHAHISPNHDVDQNIISVESRYPRATAYIIEEESTYQDTSPMSVVSSNVITNTTSVDWTTSTGWLEITGVFTVLSANNGIDLGAYQDALILGKIYQVSFTVFDYVAGTIGIKCGNSGEVVRFSNTSDGEFTVILQCAGNTNLYFMGGGGFIGKIYNIQAKELIPTKITEYTVLPENSKPTMQRLETTSTSSLTIDVSDGDLGHNLNLLPSGNGAVFKGGCYAPSGEVTFKLYRNNATPITVVLQNNDGFNSLNGYDASSIDSKGFIKVTVADLVEGNYVDETTQEYFRGLLISYDDTTWSYPDNLFSVKHILGIHPADLVCLNFFGGVYTIGLWGFDIPKMISKGMYPPYTSYDMDEIEYKLFARKTFNKDLTYHDDITSVDFLKIIWRFNFS